MTTDQRSDVARVAAGVPGGEAAKPTAIPRRGWVQVAKRGWAEAKADQVPLLAAGVAFYAFLAIFPAMLAGILIYGLVADPTQIARQVGPLTDALPGQARDLILAQLQALSQSQQKAAGFGAVIAIVLALWSASGGMGNLMTAISTTYDETETRSFVKKRGLALLLTLGAIVFMVIMLGLVAVLPAVFSGTGTSGPLRWLLEAVRWVLVAVIVAAALAVLYRVAPDRDSPRMRWVSVGAVVATLLWLLASIGFSVYVATFGNYAKTYGALAGIVVLLFWLWITCYAILLGAEINAEAEQQTVKDTTRGPDQPLGRRGAVKADTLPGAAGEPAASQGPENDPTRKEYSMSVSEPERVATVDTGQEVGVRTPPADASTGELVKQVTEDLRDLIRGELRLAQAELTEKAKHAGVGAGAFGGAGVLALYGLGVLIAAAVLGLALVLPAWLAALIVGVVVLLIAGGMALFGRKELKEATPAKPEQTIESVRQDVREIKESAQP